MLKEPLQSQFVKGNSPTVDKRETLTRKELIKEYIEPSRPVVIKHAADNWEAMGKITPEYIRQHYGHLSMNVKGIDYRFDHFIDLMLGSTPEKPAPYPFNINVERYFPELLKMCRPEIIYGKCDRVNHPLMPRRMLKGTEIYEMFLGGNGAAFPFLHIDALYLHNQMTQLYGAKEFILYPPEQTKYLYPQENNPKVSQVDIRNPDIDRFPLFREAKPLRVIIEQGETILFPTGWWHSTEIHGPCISLGRIQLNHSNWNDFLKDEYLVWKKRSRVVAPFIYGYGKLLGQVMNFQELFA